MVAPTDTTIEDCRARFEPWMPDYVSTKVRESFVLRQLLHDLRSAAANLASCPLSAAARIELRQQLEHTARELAKLNQSAVPAPPLAASRVVGALCSSQPPPAERCFACGHALRSGGMLVDTRDGQTGLVGPECWRHVTAAGDVGWQPPKGGPRLYPMRPAVLPAEIPAQPCAEDGAPRRAEA